MHRHSVEIWINPSLPIGVNDLETIDRSKLQQFKTPAYWVNYKRAGDESLTLLPNPITFSLQYDLLHQLSSTLVEPF